MSNDREVCLCFHVTKRKLQNFLRIHKPQHASQLSECFGAGTGCGWCRPFLEKLFEQSTQTGDSPTTLSAETLLDLARRAASDSRLLIPVPDQMENHSEQDQTLGADQPNFDELSAEEYAQRRAEYNRQQRRGN